MKEETVCKKQSHYEATCPNKELRGAVGCDA